ncbi:nSTAND1 domain-containing NTPase [Nonomuraea africana]|uniref:nSTAND1 domain-containing NTPase n=1 Tax=Nonomuraea africana TaxID=46171 RepID=UPI0034021144
MALPSSSAVRVQGPAGVSGGGCLVGPREVVTCAHVVSGALGLCVDERPDEPVLIDFPLFGDEHEPIAAHVVAWDAHGDLAGLRLAEPPPRGVLPTRLVSAPHYWGHPFRALGFPVGHDDSGVWAHGRLLARRGDGWLQVENTGSVGHGLRPGFSGAMVWDDELDAAVGIVVAEDKDLTTRTAYVIPADVLLRGWPELAARAPAASPYRGLEAFGESDADVFFGRAEEARELRDRVAGPGLTVVYGPSGSGKSSLVLAGLLPLLGADPGVRALTLRPSQGRTPLSALAAVLLPELEPERAEAARMADLPALTRVLRDGGIVEVVQRLRARSGADRIVLVIDQFEEIYTSRHPHEEFVTALLPLLETASAGAHTLVTLRADFSGQMLEHPRLAELQRGAVYPVGTLGRDRLREVIEAPAARAGGVRFQDGLVDRILDDVGDEQGRLPLVEFALTMLWERQRDGVLTHDAYLRLGGAAGALAAYAEQIWHERLSADPSRARSLLLQLVRQAQGQEPTCATLPKEAFSEEEWRLGQELATTRLLVAAEGPPGVHTLRLAHESLISRWDRLRDWVEADHDFRAWHHELQRALDRWSAERENDRLLRGGDLAVALDWLAKRGEDLRPAERDFVEESHRRSERLRKRQRRVSVGLALLLALSVVLGLLAGEGYVTSQERLRTLAAQVMADRAEESAERPDLRLLEAVAAYRGDPDDPKVTRALFNRYSGVVSIDRILAGSGVTSRHVLAGEDGTLVVQQESHAVKVWRPEEESPLPEQISFSARIKTTAMSPDGGLLAVATEEGTVELWSPRDRRLVDRLPGEPPGPGEDVLLALDPGGRQLAVHRTGERTVTVWDLRRRQSRGVSLPGRASMLRLGGDGLLSAALPGGRLLVFEPGATRPARTWRLPSAIANDGSTVVTCRDTGTTSTVRGVDLRTGRTVVEAALPPLDCAGVSEAGTLSHGGRLLLLQHVLVDLKEKRIIGAPSGHVESPVVTGREGRWSIWAAGGPGLVSFPVARTIDTNPFAVKESAVTDDGRHVVTYDADGRLRVWDARSRLLVAERYASLSGAPADGAAITRVVALTGRREIAVVGAGSRDLVLMSLPDLRPTASARLPAGSAEDAPLRLHAVADGRLVVFARGVVTVWESAPLRMTGPELDLSERLPPTVSLEQDEGLRLLPSADGSAALLVDVLTRRVERWDLTLGRVTRDHLIPGSDGLVPVAVSADLTRLVSHSLTAGQHFVTWRLPASGPPTSSAEAAARGDAFDLFVLRRSNPDLFYDPSFTAFRHGDSPGHLTLFRHGRQLLYHTGEARILSTAPRDWALHLCRVLGGRSFTRDELSDLPAEADTAPCTDT